MIIPGRQTTEIYNALYVEVRVSEEGHIFMEDDRGKIVISSLQTVPIAIAILKASSRIEGGLQPQFIEQLEGLCREGKPEEAQP